MSGNITELFQLYRTRLKAEYRRGLCLCYCEEHPERVIQQLDSLLNLKGVCCGLQITAPGLVTIQKPQQVLGQEFENAVLVCMDEISPNALSLLSAVVKGGGFFFVIVTKHSLRDTFSNWLFTLIRQSANTLYIDATQRWKLSGAIDFTPVKTETDASENYEEILEKIYNRGTGSARRPLLLTGDRGRGKSTAIGICAARWYMELADTDIVLSAPDKSSLTSVICHFNTISGSAFNGAKIMNGHGNSIRYVAPDQIVNIKRGNRRSIVLIDEAAGIHASQLIAVFERFNRVILVSTTHGYEGSGQGFSLKVIPLLREYYPTLETVVLNYPQRWSTGDYLENCINELFFFNKDIFVYDQGSLPTDLQLVKYEQESILNDRSLLGDIFVLLSQAHYRTEPDDLRQIVGQSGDIPIFTLQKN